MVDTTVLEADEPDEGGEEDEGVAAAEPPDVAVQGEERPTIMETEALVAEALSQEVTLDVSPEAARPPAVEEQTVVVVAEEERPRQEAVTFEPAAHQEPASHEGTLMPDPEPAAEELVRPVVREPRDLEPTDK